MKSELEEKGSGCMRIFFKKEAKKKQITQIHPVLFLWSTAAMRKTAATKDF